MGFYDDLENVLDYIAMSESFDGRRLIARLHTYLREGASLLEVGMGAGKDLELLSRRYKAIGSDRSRVFLDLYCQKFPSAELLELDAANLELEETFDGIYSNKVLHHLSRTELMRSFVRQHAILNPGGIALHSFWAGVGQEEHNQLLYVYYEERDIRRLVESHFEILEMKRYNEMKVADSIYVVLRRLNGVKSVGETLG